MTNDVLLTGPELTFCDLALDRTLSDTELVEIGFELCGTYLLDSDADSWYGFVNLDEPLTSVDKIDRFIERRGTFPGLRRAKKVLGMVLDRSNSPMETVLACLLTMPRRLGGMGFAGGVMNHPVQTSVGLRHVDLAFPKQGVGLEYKGKRTHPIEVTVRDDRRQNKLVGAGMTILNVWYEDIVELHLFDQLVVDVARAMKTRVRIESKRFPGRRDVLRMSLIPRFKELQKDID